MKLPAKVKLLIVVILVLLYYPLLGWSMESMNLSGITPDAIRLHHMLDPRILVYFLLFDHAMMMPLYPWLIVLLMTSVVFKGITSPKVLRSKDVFKRDLGRIAIIGASLIVLGIAAGSGLMRDYDSTTFNELLLHGQYFTWPYPNGMLTFLIRHVPQSILYGMGIVCVWFACLGWYQVVKDKHLPLQGKVNNVGMYSLTAYLLTHVAMAIPIRLPMATFYMIFIPSLVLFVWGMWMWNKKYHGIGTLEFAMEAYAQAISTLIDKHNARHGE